MMIPETGLRAIATLALMFGVASAACGGEESITPLTTTSSTGGGGGSGAQGGAGGDGGGTGGSTTGVPLLGGKSCDPMVPTQCGFPFPSNVFLANADQPSMRRVKLGESTLPRFNRFTALDPALVADRDGFSPGQAPMTHLPGATVTGLATQHTIALSLTTESPTILLDADTGELVPHFAEVDMTEPDIAQRTFFIRPVVRLPDAHRFIVAIRRVVGENAQPLPPSETFKALRDKLSSEEPSVDLRRSLYEDIFTRLEAAGVGRSDLQIAWDYTTASKGNTVDWLVHMRDDALATVGPDGPAYVIDTVTDDPNPEIKRRIEGRMTVPLYLTSQDPGASLVFENGLPKQNGVAQFPFIVQIPHAAITGTPGAILQNGHGLLGSRNEGRNGYLATIANRGNFVTISVDLVGMAEEDEATVIKAISEDPNTFRPFVDRQLQGIVNELLAMRMMMGAFAEDAQVTFNGTSAIDTSRRFYRGDSQGGIFGATYMALTTDVERGLLGEPGAPYNLLLNRSVDFNAFFAILQIYYGTSRDVQLVLATVQMLWDRTEPIGYLPYVTNGELPNTPAHAILIHAAVGDHQVTPLGAHLMARAFNAKLYDPAARDIWGLTKQGGTFVGSAIVEYDYKELVPPVPDTNTPTTASDTTDPHDWVRQELTAIDQSAHFFRTGEVKAFCDGPCDPN